MLCSCILNPLVAAALSCGVAVQFLLVLGNRTMVAPRDRAYDVGLRTNWQQV